MAKVKFVVAVHYKGARVPAHTPFDVADEDVPALVKDGAIVIGAPVPKQETPPTPPANTGNITPPPPPASTLPTELEKELAAIADMSVSKLKEYAELHEIDISGKTLKEDIRTAIEDALSFEE